MDREVAYGHGLNDIDIIPICGILPDSEIRPSLFAEIILLRGALSRKSWSPANDSRHCCTKKKYVKSQNAE